MACAERRIASRAQRQSAAPLLRVAAVGDSMAHDVAGATAAGVDSIFVAGGVHAADLGVAAGAGASVDAARLDAFLARFDARPTYAVPGFRLS